MTRVSQGERVTDHAKETVVGIDDLFSNTEYAQPDAFGEAFSLRLRVFGKGLVETYRTLREQPGRSTGAVVTSLAVGGTSFLGLTEANASQPELTATAATSPQNSDLAGNSGDTHSVEGQILRLSASSWGNVRWVYRCLARAENERTPATREADPVSICAKGLRKRTTEENKPVAKGVINLACPNNEDINTRTTFRITRPKDFVKAVARIDIGKTWVLTKQLGKLKFKVGTRLNCPVSPPKGPPRPIDPSPELTPPSQKPELGAYTDINHLYPGDPADVSVDVFVAEGQKVVLFAKGTLVSFDESSKEVVGNGKFQTIVFRMVAGGEVGQGSYTIKMVGYDQEVSDPFPIEERPVTPATPASLISNIPYFSTDNNKEGEDELK